MNPATGPHGTPRKRPAATAETTTEKTTEDKLREECARLRSDNRALRRAEARRQFPPSAALYGPATGKAGPLLTGRELVVASKERPYIVCPGRGAPRSGTFSPSTEAASRSTERLPGSSMLPGTARRNTAATSATSRTADEPRTPTTSRRVGNTPDPRAAPMTSGDGRPSTRRRSEPPPQ